MRRAPCHSSKSCPKVEPSLAAARPSRSAEIRLARSRFARVPCGPVSRTPQHYALNSCNSGSFRAGGTSSRTTLNELRPTSGMDRSGFESRMGLSRWLAKRFWLNQASHVRRRCRVGACGTASSFPSKAGWTKCAAKRLVLRACVRVGHRDAEASLQSGTGAKPSLTERQSKRGFSRTRFWTYGRRRFMILGHRCGPTPDWHRHLPLHRRRRLDQTA